MNLFEKTTVTGVASVPEMPSPTLSSRTTAHSVISPPWSDSSMPFEDRP